MQIIGADKVNAFVDRHANARGPVKRWVKAVQAAEWKHHADLKRDFPSADYVGNSRYVFNLKGNSYRLVVIVTFFAGRLTVRFIGTHPEYNRIDASTI